MRCGSSGRRYTNKLAERACLSVSDEVLVLHRSLQIRGEVEVEEQELKSASSQRTAAKADAEAMCSQGNSMVNCSPFLKEN